MSSRLLGAELGGALGGAALLLLALVAALYFHRQRRASRMPVRQVPAVSFVVNPTWVPGHPSPSTPRSAGAAANSDISLPDRARTRKAPIVAPQASMPNLRAAAPAAQHPSSRARASTVGSESGSGKTGARLELARMVTAGSRELYGDAGVGVGMEASPSNRSDSSVWRPRIDILGARNQQRVRDSGTESFWVDKV